MVTPVEKIQKQMQRIETDIDRISRQATFGEQGAAMKRDQLSKLENALAARKRTLVRLQERQHA